MNVFSPILFEISVFGASLRYSSPLKAQLGHLAMKSRTSHSMFGHLSDSKSKFWSVVMYPKCPKRADFIFCSISCSDGRSIAMIALSVGFRTSASVEPIRESWSAIWFRFPGECENVTFPSFSQMKANTRAHLRSSQKAAIPLSRASTTDLLSMNVFVSLVPLNCVVCWSAHLTARSSPRKEL